MEPNEEMLGLLREIRDVQTEHLAEYRRAAERSIALQEEGVARYERLARLYRKVLVAVFGVIGLLVVYVLTLFVRMG